MNRNTYQTQQAVEKYIGRGIFNAKYLIYITVNTDVHETIHHINGNAIDNRPENFYLFRTPGEHVSYHSKIIAWARKMLGMSYDERVKHLDTFPDLKSNLDDIKQMTTDTELVWQYVYKFSSPSNITNEIHPEVNIDRRKRLLQQQYLEKAGGMER